MARHEAAQLVVIGAGPGGYAAAFRAATRGMRVTLVDPEEHPGGVCLHRGCIPSKALLHAARLIRDARDAAQLGLAFGEPRIDVDRLRAWKNEVVRRLTSGVGRLAQLHQVDMVRGRAAFVDSAHVRLIPREGGERTLAFEHAIIATGSEPVRLREQPESPRILDSTGALDLPDVPRSLLVVGGGYIGLELGSVYAALGSRVSVVEMTASLLPGVDRDLVTILARSVQPLFAEILLETTVTGMRADEEGVEVRFVRTGASASTGASTSTGTGTGVSTGEAQRAERYERVLVAVGRRPLSRGADLEKTRVRLDDHGFIAVDPQRRTHDPRIFAIGDIAGQPLLAHKATHEGLAAVDAIGGARTVFEPRAIPAVVYTDPEVAWCGLTESEARASGREIAVARYPWAASGRAITLARTDGMTKVIAEPGGGRILGVGIVGPGAGELISEAALAIEMSAVAGDLRAVIHPHPTLSETLMEAADLLMGESTHFFAGRGPKRA